MDDETIAERAAIEVEHLPDAEAHRIWQAKIAAAKVRRKWGEALKKKVDKSENNA